MKPIRLKKRLNGYIYAYGCAADPISLKTKSMAEAKVIARELGLEKIAQARKLGLLKFSVVQAMQPGKKVTVGLAIDEFLESLKLEDSGGTRVRMSAVLRPWSKQQDIARTPISAIEGHHIDGWINGSSPLKYATRKRYLVVLTLFFKFCQNQSWTSGNPAATTTVKHGALTQAQLLPRITDPFTPEEVARILASLKVTDFWYFATQIAYYTGLRMGDIARLERSNLAWPWLTVHTGKTGVLVRHKLPPEMAATIAAITPNPRSYYLFAGMASLQQSSLSGQFKTICDECGMKGKHFSALRHTHAMQKLATERRSIFDSIIEQLSIEGVAKSLGHKSTKTTQIYLSHAQPEGCLQPAG